MKIATKKQLATLKHPKSSGPLPQGIPTQDLERYVNGVIYQPCGGGRRVIRKRPND